jgi:dsDNA-binding SOS-regulon protein
LEEASRADLKETLWELVYELSRKEISWDNWPEVYAEAAVNKMAKELNLRDEVVSLIQAERAYSKAKKNFESWLSWKKERNPARRLLEVKCGYDSKHASHLVRLMRMGKEILATGNVIVKRPDAEELLAIKNGAWSYDRVVEYAETLQRELDEEYKSMEESRKKGLPVVLPKSVDYVEFNQLYHQFTEDYLRKTS